MTTRCGAFPAARDDDDSTRGSRRAHGSPRRGGGSARSCEASLPPDDIKTAGATAVVCVLTPSHAVCAWAGDSRCVLGAGGAAMPLSVDHKPTAPVEKARVEASGGAVFRGRVNGDLGVARALGDYRFKDRKVCGEVESRRCD